MWFIIVYYIVVISFLYFSNPVVKLQEEFQYLKMGEKKKKRKRKEKKKKRPLAFIRREVAITKYLVF